MLFLDVFDVILSGMFLHILLLLPGYLCFNLKALHISPLTGLFQGQKEDCEISA